MPKVLILGAGAVLVGWAVVKTSSADALIRDNPAAAAAVAPDDPRFAFLVATAQVMQNRGVVSKEAAEATRRAMARAPLAEEPFLIEAIAALVRGEEARAERLLTEARNRNPRSRTIRLLLLDRHMRGGRDREAAQEIAVLGRLIPAASSVLVPEVAKFARDPKTRPVLIDVLRSDPEMAEKVLAHLASKSGDPELVTSLAARVPGGPGATRAWQAPLIEALVARGDIARAHGIWSKLPGVSATDGAVYDPRFRGLPGPPPFNWKLASGNAGVAERGQGGLQVDYYGRNAAELASQIIRLAPGRYRLTARVEGDASGDGARLTWRLLCRAGGAELANLPLREVSYSPKIVAADLTIPGGCPVQTLRLDGIPSEFPKTQSVTVSEINIGRAAAA